MTEVERDAQGSDTGIVKRPESPLAIPQVPYEGFISISSVYEVLEVCDGPFTNLPINPGHQTNLQRIREVLGEHEPPQEVIDYINSIQRIRQPGKLSRRPKEAVVIWTDETVERGSALLQPYLRQRANHPLISTLESLKDSALNVRDSLGESIVDTRRYLGFFFPHLPLDETEEIRFEAIIPIGKKYLWGAYENTGIPFRTHGTVQRALEKEEPIMTGPFLQEERYQELAQILGSNLTSFASNLNEIEKLTREVRAQLGVEEEPQRLVDGQGRLASAVSIVNETAREISSQPSNPKSGIMGMYLWRALTEIRKKVIPLIGEDISANDRGFESKRRRRLVPQINAILTPRYRIFFNVLEEQGFGGWREDWLGRREDVLIKRLDSTLS